ncbi:MAG: SNF2-related protein [Planctomycetota bacterium]
MSLTQKYRRHFSVLDQREGEDYFRQGRVESVQRDNGNIWAQVRGKKESYSVFWEQQGDYFCTCRTYYRLRICKHLWALLCQADADDKSGPDANSSWRFALKRLGWSEETESEADSAEHAISYALSWPANALEGNVYLQVLTRKRLKSGRWGATKFVQAERLESLAEEDLEIVSWLQGARRREASDFMDYGRHYDRYSPGLDLVLPDHALAALLPVLCKTGRFHIGSKEFMEDEVLKLDEDGVWIAEPKLEGEKRLVLDVDFVRGDSIIKSSEILEVLAGGWILTDRTFRRFGPEQAMDWLAWLEEHPVIIDKKDVDEFFAAAQDSTLGAALQPPEGWETATVAAKDIQPVLVLSAGRVGRVIARLDFDYGDLRVAADQASQWADPKERLVFSRQEDTEAPFRSQLLKVLSPEPKAQLPFELSTSEVSSLVTTMRAEGWATEANGKPIRTSTGSSATVRSTIDWFDLKGGIQFGDEFVSFPRILTTLRRGESQIVLDDGSRGILPEEWMRRRGLLESAEVEGDSLRFRQSQCLLLDMLLESEPQPDIDAQFRRIRKALKNFKSPQPVTEPRGFQGELRAYQREGLGWIKFLEKFGFGGCLADDMGLGKTVQVLAYLQSKKAKRGPKAATLVVAPRSVVPNWINEANKFAPNLKVLDYSGSDRKNLVAEFSNHDLVITTYGLMRRDIEVLREQEFGCLILDESQAIKNAKSQTAKAARLLRGRQKLALSGTPIENHIDELWSLFEFLNPGMFGATKVLQELAQQGEDGRRQLAEALTPFILRRKKDEVAKDLPTRSEQTLICVLPKDQRKVYDGLLQHYRASLSKKIEAEGLGRSKMHVLEALTRLRQAACHPALIDATSNVASAKVDLLMERLEEVVGEGHKALVFSQFTKFLAIVRKRLDQANITHEYLDGKTRKREQKVERFQTDPDCPLFLISLKAGGTGLNLTAADYVFLLDPWWNPAVEAQAIDRAHRIGQTRNVFAYRLIAKDTIEEKILALQGQKRDLAESILSGGSKTLRDLTREDLEMLLA